MATVRELSAPYENFMRPPRSGEGTCGYCFNLTDGYERCYACSHQPAVLDVVAPISYSVAHEQLHHALSGYKRPPDVVAERFQLELAAVLWRYLQAHEGCLASAAHADRFEIVSCP